MKHTDSWLVGTFSYEHGLVLEIQLTRAALRGRLDPIRNICAQLGSDLLERRHPGRCCGRRLYCALWHHQPVRSSRIRRERVLAVRLCLHEVSLKLTWYSASGKVLLIFMLFCFTFITMVRKTSYRSENSTTNESGWW